MIIDILLGALYFLGIAIEGGFGWRYLLSASYRQRMHGRWEKKDKVVWEQRFMMFMHFLVFNFFIFLLVVWLLSGTTVTR